MRFTQMRTLQRLSALLPALIHCLTAGQVGQSQTRPLYATGTAVTRYYSGTTSKVTSLFSPISPVYDAQGNLFTVNYGQGTVTRVTPSGAMRLFASGLTNANGMGIDNQGNLVVSTSNFAGSTAPLFKVSLNGTVTTFVTIPNKACGAVTVDSSGNIFVQAAGTIYKVTPAGLVSTFATLASGINTFYGLVGDSAGNVYATGREFNGGEFVTYVYKIAPDGTVSQFATLSQVIFGSPASGAGLTADGSGNVYAYFPGNNPGTILKVTSDGFVSTFASFDIPGPGGINFSLPQGIAYDGHGNFAVCGTSPSIVFTVKSDATVTTLATGTGTTTGIAYDGYGTFTVADTTNKLLDTISVDGTVKNFAAIPNAGSLDGLTEDGAGNIYVADKTNNVVYKVTPTGVISTFLSGLSSPQSVGFDSVGNFYVLNGAQVVKTSSMGTNVTIFAQNLTSAYGLTLDSADNVYVSSTSGSVSKITQAGSITTYTTRSGYGLVFDNTGDLYLAGSSSISKIAPGGTATTISGSGSAIYLAFGQGVPNLILQNNNSNQIVLWTMAGTTVLGGAFTNATPAAGYRVVGSGDFKHDGSTDIVFQNQTTNKIAIWYMHGTTVAGGDLITAVPGSDYKIVGVSDMNGDGYDDLIFQSKSTGQIVVWYMNGATFIGGAALPYAIAAGWNVVGVGDMDGDGKADLVFQNQATGRLLIWYMNHTTYLGGASLNAAPAAGWTVQGLGYIAGGVENLILQNQSTGQIAFWYMQNTVYTGGGLVSFNPSTLWSVCNTH